MLNRFLLLFSSLCFLAHLSFSQPTLQYEAAFSGLASPEPGQMPHWLVYNRNGVYNGNDNEAVGYLDLDFDYTFGDWKVESGVKGVSKFPVTDSYLQEAYVNLGLGKFKLIAGKQELTFGDYHEGLSSGSFYLSGNARPLPRIGIGFYEYTDVPFTNGYIQVKGFLNQGFLDDDRGARGTNKPLFHEKIAYIRTNKLAVNPHFGISHSALLGGTIPNGTKIPVDYKATFFAKSSKKVGEVFYGEETNVAGGHFGLFDIGANFKMNESEIQAYLQKPVKDKSGFAETFRRNKDFIFGLSIKNIKSSLVSEFIYERIYTEWQCGPGIPDPVVNGRYYVAGYIKDYDQFMLDNYGIVVENISEEDFWRFIRNTENYGYEYGGRDSYYNNGMYYKGWSYQGNALGNSLLLTLDRIKSINPAFNDSYDYFFANTRISAHHFGFRGSFHKNLDYRFLYTYTNNLGTYAGLNKGALNWDSKNPDSDYKYFFSDNDYFVDGKYESYVLLETDYSFPKTPGLSLNFNFGFDYGKMYRSYGFLAGVKYSGNVLSEKK